MVRLMLANNRYRIYINIDVNKDNITNIDNFENKISKEM